MEGKQKGDNAMTYEIANEVMIITVTDDLEEALEIAMDQDAWINVFDSKGRYVETISPTE